jgi:hypothetical protein
MSAMWPLAITEVVMMRARSRSLLSRAAFSQGLSKEV